MNFKNAVLFFILFLAGSLSVHLFAVDFECISSIRRLEVEKSKLRITDTIVCQVNNRNGERYSDFAVFYSKISKLTTLNAWIEDSNGNRIRNLKSTEFQDRSWVTGFSLYQDDRIRFFQMKHNTYPYRVCYTSTVAESEFNELTDWRPLDNKDYPVREALLYVTLPKDYGVFSNVNNVTEVKSDTLEDGVVIRYLVKDKSVVFGESGKGPFNFNRPRVVVVPKYFQYGVEGSMESWESFGNWYDLLNSGLTKLPDTEIRKISTMVDGITDTVTIVKKLYQYLQDNTRYVNVSIGIGGFKAFPASYVVQNKYGDCKALTNYMKALLEARGIKSYFVIINSDEQPMDFLETLPSPQFNHVLLAVPVGKDTLWLENTSSICPFGYVGSLTQNRKALFVDKERSHLISMPALKKQDVVCLRKMSFNFDEIGNADLFAVFSDKGPIYEYLNVLNHYCAEKDKRDYINNFIPFENYELMDWQFGKVDRDSANIDLRLRLHIPKVAKMMGADCYIRTFSIPTGKIRITPPVNLSATLPWPVCNVDSSIYVLPSGYSIKKLPDPVHFSIDCGDYVSDTRVSEGKIYVYKKLEISQKNYSATEYEQLYGFLKKISESENSSIICLTSKIDTR